MKKRDYKSLYIIFSIIIYAILYRFFIVKYLLKYSEMITATVMLVIAFITYLFFGFQKNKFNTIRKEVSRMIVISVLLYFIATYGLGFAIGFLKNSYSMNPLTMLGNVVGPFLLIILSEFIRYVLIKTNKDKKYVIILVTVALIVLDLVINVNIPKLSFDLIFVEVTTKVIPIMVKHIVLSYITLELGYIPPLFYRLMMELYIYIVPVVPDIGNYFISMLGVIMPLMIFLYSSRMLKEYYNGVERDFSKKMFSIFDIPFVLITILFMVLISGFFQFQLVGVASGSMKPTINKGDAVLIDQKISVDTLEEGDIVAYLRDDLIIIHRIVNIEVDGDRVIFNTKGDYNNTEDDINLEIEDIKGKVIFRVPYIAWPTVWLSETFD